MTTRRLGFIMTVAALAVCWAAAASESAQKCKSTNPKQDFPATGQTTSSPRPPYHAGDDGDIQAGATLSYTDNGDGTITDNNTCLVWRRRAGPPTRAFTVFSWPTRGTTPSTCTWPRSTRRTSPGSTTGACRT